MRMENLARLPSESSVGNDLNIILLVEVCAEAYCCTYPSIVKTSVGSLRPSFCGFCFASNNMRRCFGVDNNTKGRVLIMSNDDPNGTGLLASADAWRRIAKDLVNGVNVQKAVDNVNNDPHYKNDLNLQFVPTGDMSLCLHGSCRP